MGQGDGSNDSVEIYTSYNHKGRMAKNKQSNLHFLKGQHVLGSGLEPYTQCTVNTLNPGEKPPSAHFTDLETKFPGGHTTFPSSPS